jgi:hypothetical protein
MRSIEQQRSVEIVPGFSPKPLAPVIADTTSPTAEPETKSPTPLLDGPLVVSRILPAPPSAGIKMEDGIVSFGK